MAHVGRAYRLLFARDLGLGVLNNQHSWPANAYLRISPVGGPLVGIVSQLNLVGTVEADHTLPQIDLTCESQMHGGTEWEAWARWTLSSDQSVWQCAFEIHATGVGIVWSASTTQAAQRTNYGTFGLASAGQVIQHVPAQAFLLPFGSCGTVPVPW